MLRHCTMVFAILLSTSSLFAAPPARDMSGHKERNMRNCPSGVRGAVTSADNRPDGVLLRVTSDDPTAQAEIRRRARRQADIARQPARGALEHTGQGTGAGEMGYCPGMEQGTVIGVEELPTGALLRVTARSPRNVEKIQQTTHERLKALRAGD